MIAIAGAFNQGKALGRPFANVRFPALVTDRCPQGRSLQCMNEVFGQLGEYNTVKQNNDTVVPCLAACEDQINQISISQSTLPNA